MGLGRHYGFRNRWRAFKAVSALGIGAFAFFYCAIALTGALDADPGLLRLTLAPLAVGIAAVSLWIGYDWLLDVWSRRHLRRPR